MKKAVLLLSIIAASFCLGFACNAWLTAPDQAKAGHVTGLGGIFFKCKDPKKVRAWYAENLGLHVNEYGSVFEWYQGADSTKKGFTQWSPFSEKTTYFAPSTKDFMINYRVENLRGLIADLKGRGVTVVDTIAVYDYGSFVHILDIEGNKIELWEPDDAVYEQMGKSMGATTTK